MTRESVCIWSRSRLVLVAGGLLFTGCAAYKPAPRDDGSGWIEETSPERLRLAQLGRNAAIEKQSSRDTFFRQAREEEFVRDFLEKKARERRNTTRLVKAYVAYHPDLSVLTVAAIQEGKFKLGMDKEQANLAFLSNKKLWWKSTLRTPEGDRWVLKGLAGRKVGLVFEEGILTRIVDPGCAAEEE